MCAAALLALFACAIGEGNADVNVQNRDSIDLLLLVALRCAGTILYLQHVTF